MSESINYVSSQVGPADWYKADISPYSPVAFRTETIALNHLSVMASHSFFSPSEFIMELHWSKNGDVRIAKTRYPSYAEILNMSIYEIRDRVVLDLARQVVAETSQGVEHLVIQKLIKMVDNNPGHAILIKNSINNYDSIVAKKARSLPAINERVDLPCQCKTGVKQHLESVVIHLNDYHQWTREKIADWIDELHDNGIINAEFDPWEEDQKEETPSNDAFAEWKIQQYYAAHKMNLTNITDINPS